MNPIRTIGHAVATLALVLALGWGAHAPSATADAPASPQERAEALWQQAAALHVEERYRAAARRFREAIALHPSARAHTWLAWSLSELGRLDEAVRHCRRSIELDPDYPNAYNDLGAYLVDLDRPREAERWLRAALELDDYCCPHYAWYHLARALILQGRFEEAREALHQSLRQTPRYRPALRLLHLLRTLDLHAT